MNTVKWAHVDWVTFNTLSMQWKSLSNTSLSIHLKVIPNFIHELLSQEKNDHTRYFSLYIQDGRQYVLYGNYPQINLNIRVRIYICKLVQNYSRHEVLKKNGLKWCFYCKFYEIIQDGYQVTTSFLPLQISKLG